MIGDDKPLYSNDNTVRVLLEREREREREREEDEKDEEASRRYC
jgi:hypothetical protein